MLSVILAFVVGVAVGLMYARWRSEQRANAAGAPPARGVTAPNRKAKKAGLTEADFAPSDDILERLALAEAGQLDPAELVADEAVPSPPTNGAGQAPVEPAPEDPAASPLDPAAMTDAERRVFERLRRMSAEQPTEDELE